MKQMQEAPLPSYEQSARSTYLDFNSVSLTVLNQIGTSINGIGNDLVQSNAITNKHFDTPKQVDTLYTGRKTQAESLKQWLLPASPIGSEKALGKVHAEQKRFVIYGVGGAGKTQFCCKFAEDNRERQVYLLLCWLDKLLTGHIKLLGSLLGRWQQPTTTRTNLCRERVYHWRGRSKLKSCFAVASKPARTLAADHRQC
jgi:hypothetical protein